MTYSVAQIWAIIAALTLGTFVLRFSFLGLIGRNRLPDWVLRHLRYTPVAVLPGLIAPLVLFPAATDGQPDAARLLAALVTLVLGRWTRSVLWAILGGAVTVSVVLAFAG